MRLRLPRPRPGLTATTSPVSDTLRGVRVLVLKARVVWVALSLCTAGCDRGREAEAVEPPSASAEASKQAAAPSTIDAEWVATKFQAPPPEPDKDWLREIEKDPIAALEQMDPAALQRRAPQPRPQQVIPIRAKNPAKYDLETPLRGWPPVVGQFYPDLALKDQTGRVSAISDFRGKVILLEVVGMTCKACNAFAGGNERGVGGFRGIPPQSGLGSIEQYAQRYAGVSLDHPDVIFVQLILYGMDGRSPPSEADVRAWATHFGMDRNLNEVVLTGDQRFISPETRALIPGFHLIDRNGILRALSSNNPSHDRLYDGVLPKIAALLE